jgi:raffinose/stachyose/melibiose transport system permease protein
VPYYFARGGFSRAMPYLLLGPGIALYLLISLGPSLATSVYSLTDANGLQAAPFNWVGLANYQEFLFRGAAAAQNIAAGLRTLVFCIAVTVIQFAIGLLIAMLLNQKLRGTRFFRTLFFLPVILGVTIQGLIWSLFLYPLGGPVDNFLDVFGVHKELLGGPAAEAFAWVIVVQVWSNVGITMVIFLAGLQTIPGELVEAAKIDGASAWQTFRNVTWPLLTPSVNTNLILNVIGSLQAWQLFLVLINYRVGTYVLGYTAYAQAFGQTSGSTTANSFRQGYGAAASMVLFGLVLVIGLTVQYFLRKREERLLG